MYVLYIYIYVIFVKVSFVGSNHESVRLFGLGLGGPVVLVKDGTRVKCDSNIVFEARLKETQSLGARPDWFLRTKSICFLGSVVLHASSNRVARGVEQGCVGDAAAW